MALLIILPSEREVLLDRSKIHVVDSDVFNYLCERMDGKSGKIGVKSALSYSRMSSDLSESVPRKAKGKLVVLTRRMVRSSVERLVSFGLFRCISTSSFSAANTADKDKNRMMFVRVHWSLLLSSNCSVQNPEAQQTAQQLRAIASLFSSSISNLYDNDHSSGHGSGAADGTSNSIYISTPDESNFSMHLAWEPDRTFVNKVLNKSGYDNNDVKKIWFGNYVTYWSERSDRKSQKE